MGGGSNAEASSKAVRTLSVLVAPVFAIYTILVVTGIVPNHRFPGAMFGVAIALLWVAVSIYYYLRPARRISDQALRIVIIHAFALALFVLVIGFSQPFAILFVLLFLAANIYFGRKGFALSVGAFALAALIDILLYMGTYPAVVVQTGLSALSIIMVGSAIIGIYKYQETRRQELQHSQDRERLQYDRILTIINNLSDAAFSTNEKGEVLMYNAASLDLLDTNQALKGRSLGSLLNLKDSDGATVNILTLLKEANRATRRDDLSHTYGDDESVRLELSYAPIRSNYSRRLKASEQGGYIVILRDVTKQKSLEEERDEFISVVSHELRTPITIVEGTLSNLDVLMHRPEVLDQKTLAKMVTTAHDQVLYLAKMVNDLSTLSRAERGVADAAEQIDVTDLLHTMHHQYQRDAELKGLHLDLDIGHSLGTVHVSRLYLEELLQNFITNAIKYTKEGSVTILAQTKKGVVTFSVKDTGIGISRTDQNKVFNKFYRSEDYRTRETSGTGLGLYVSAKLAKKLQTTIELKSRLNHGSTFSFSLPVE